MTIEITDEMIAAWRTLQEYAQGGPRYLSPYQQEQKLVEAIKALDDSDFMMPIQDAGECGNTSAPLPEPPCDLDKPCPVHQEKDA